MTNRPTFFSFRLDKFKLINVNLMLLLTHQPLLCRRSLRLIMRTSKHLQIRSNTSFVLFNTILITRDHFLTVSSSYVIYIYHHISKSPNIYIYICISGDLENMQQHLCWTECSSIYYITLSFYKWIFTGSGLAYNCSLYSDSIQHSGFHHRLMELY